MNFDRVKEILENSLREWQVANGAAPDLSGHGATFKWSTKEELLAAAGKGKRLIQPELIGTADAGKTNLIIDLRVGFGGRRMPDGGPFIPDPEIQEIEDWIRSGCPD